MGGAVSDERREEGDAVTGWPGRLSCVSIQ